MHYEIVLLLIIIFILLQPISLTYFVSPAVPDYVYFLEGFSLRNLPPSSNTSSYYIMIFSNKAIVSPNDLESISVSQVLVSSDPYMVLTAIELYPSNTIVVINASKYSFIYSDIIMASIIKNHTVTILNPNKALVRDIHNVENEVLGFINPNLTVFMESSDNDALDECAVSRTCIFKISIVPDPFNETFLTVTSIVMSSNESLIESLNAFLDIESKNFLFYLK